MAVLKQGLKGSNLISSNNRKTTSTEGSSKPTLWLRYFGVVNGIDLPTPKMYKQAEGRLGTIFYLDAEAAKNN